MKEHFIIGIKFCFRFLQDCRQYLGTTVSDMIERIKRDEFPLLVLIQGKSRSCNVADIIQGKPAVEYISICIKHYFFIIKYNVGII